jgi:hypothetical protein
MRARERIKKTFIELLKDNSADMLAVKTLCIEANISKQTLYNNFYGIPDAIGEAICDIIDEKAGRYFGQNKWMTGMEIILILFDENKDVVMHLWNSKLKDEAFDAISSHAYMIIARGIHECEVESGIRVPRQDEAIMAGLYLDIFMGLLRRYMEQKMTQDPKQLVRGYGAVLEKDTSFGLKRISEKYK